MIAMGQEQEPEGGTRSTFPRPSQRKACRPARKEENRITKPEDLCREHGAVLRVLPVPFLRGLADWVLISLVERDVAARVSKNRKSHLYYDLRLELSVGRRSSAGTAIPPAGSDNLISWHTRDHRIPNTIMLTANLNAPEKLPLKTNNPGACC
jgi:hypothetical protein